MEGAPKSLNYLKVIQKKRSIFKLQMSDWILMIFNIKKYLVSKSSYFKS